MKNQGNKGLANCPPFGKKFMTVELNSNEATELTIFDLFNFLRNGWKTLSISILTSGLIGLGYAYISPARFQATAVMVMASIQGGEVNDGTQTILLEKPNNLVEKLKLPLFYSEKTIEECELKDNKLPNQTISKRVKASLVKNTTYVSIGYIDNSPENASKCLTSIVQDIKDDQLKIINPILEYRNSQLDLLRTQLNQANHLLNKSTYFYSQKILQTEIDKLSLQFATIKNAELITPIFSPSARIEPTRSQIILLSLVMGSLIGLLILKLKKLFTRK